MILEREDVVFVGLLAFVLQSAPAGDGSSNAVIQNKPVKEKVICIDDTQTGTLISKRICHTKSQWKMLSDQGQQSVDTFRNAAHAGFCPPNNPGCMGG